MMSSNDILKLFLLFNGKKRFLDVEADWSIFCLIFLVVGSPTRSFLHTGHRTCLLLHSDSWLILSIYIFTQFCCPPTCLFLLSIYSILLTVSFSTLFFRSSYLFYSSLCLFRSASFTLFLRPSCLYDPSIYLFGPPSCLFLRFVSSVLSVPYINLPIWSIYYFQLCLPTMSGTKSVIAYWSVFVIFL